MSGTTAAFVFAIHAYRYGFGAEFIDTDDVIIRVKYVNLSISCMSMVGSSHQIISIFLWKQSILSWMKKGRCILIKYSPHIKWIENDVILSNVNATIELSKDIEIVYPQNVDDDVNEKT